MLLGFRADYFLHPCHTDWWHLPVAEAKLSIADQCGNLHEFQLLLPKWRTHADSLTQPGRWKHWRCQFRKLCRRRIRVGPGLESTLRDRCGRVRRVLHEAWLRLEFVQRLQFKDQPEAGLLHECRIQGEPD